MYIYIYVYRFKGPSAWISFQCRDDSSIADGSCIEQVIHTLEATPGLKYLGINCTQPEYVLNLITKIHKLAPKIGIVMYANDGRVWDDVERDWAVEGKGGFEDELVQSWLECVGSEIPVLIGGCCGVTPQGIANINKVLSKKETS